MESEATLPPVPTTEATPVPIVQSNDLDVDAFVASIPDEKAFEDMDADSRRKYIASMIAITKNSSTALKAQKAEEERRKAEEQAIREKYRNDIDTKMTKVAEAYLTEEDGSKVSDPDRLQEVKYLQEAISKYHAPTATLTDLQQGSGLLNAVYAHDARFRARNLELRKREDELVKAQKANESLSRVQQFEKQLNNMTSSSSRFAPYTPPIQKTEPKMVQAPSTPLPTVVASGPTAQERAEMARQYMRQMTSSQSILAGASSRDGKQ